MEEAHLLVALPLAHSDSDGQIPKGLPRHQHQDDILGQEQAHARKSLLLCPRRPPPKLNPSPPVARAQIFPVRGGELVNFVGYTSDEHCKLLKGHSGPWKELRPIEDVLADYEGWSEKCLNIVRVSEAFSSRQVSE
jgi:hypothetical protein